LNFNLHVRSLVPWQQHKLLCIAQASLLGNKRIIVSEYWEAVSECSLPIDVVLRSRNGATFGAHTDNLARYTGAFPKPGILTRTDSPEVVNLDERSEVILLILQFTHPDTRPPQTHDVWGDVMVELAEAVEKFLVFPAMEVCNLRLT